MAVRVLHSFPIRLGAGRICTTAWYEVIGAARAGIEVTVVAGSVSRPLPPEVTVKTTLSRGGVRIPLRLLGGRAFALHDRLVARSLPRLAGDVDVIHLWPLAALETMTIAKHLGIPTVLERPNAHTRFAMEEVRAECERLGVALPPGHEHAYDAAKLAREEAEYRLADHLLCPSEFVVDTFRERGFPPSKLVRHVYGYDDRVFHAAAEHSANAGLRALFVGVCAVRKGLHFALQAWLASPASARGRFRIAGEFLPGYREKLAPLLAHPSVEVLGHRGDVAELMRASDVLMLPSIEEGFGLTCVEAMASGCVPLVSNRCTDACVDGVSALVHGAGDVQSLSKQLTVLDRDRAELKRLRRGALEAAEHLTWWDAGSRLAEVYRLVATAHGADASLVA